MLELIDHTGTSKGYLRLMRDDKRVADFFPFAYGTDPEWVREQANHVVRVLNDAEVRSCHGNEDVRQ